MSPKLKINFHKKKYVSNHEKRKTSEFKRRKRRRAFLKLEVFFFYSIKIKPNIYTNKKMCFILKYLH